jgi:hypothetical protein
MNMFLKFEKNVKLILQSPKKKNNPEVAVMSRKDIALMEEYANYELDPIMKNLLQKLMICRPRFVITITISDPLRSLIFISSAFLKE